MSGMGSVGACGGGASAANADMTAMRANMDPSKMAERMQNKLDEKLSDAGVSEETREALHSDLSAAMEAQMSSGARPNPGAMKETIGSIFEGHGLNAADFMPQGPPSMGGMGGMRGMGGMPSMMGASSADGGQAESLQSLLESLQEEDDSDDSESLFDTDAIYSDVSQQILDILLGFDEEA